MIKFEELYEQSEFTQVRFIGFHSEYARYDFAIVYTSHFFGKPLIVDIQTNRSVLLCPDEANNIEWIKKVFQIESQEEAEELAHFFQRHLPTLPLQNQY